MSIHSFLPLTYANGPGARCCLWVQGCSLGCAGCFNPETHGFNNDKLVDVSTIFSWIDKAPGIEGLTVSGGEPLQQPEALASLLTLVRSQMDLSVLVFTGFAFDEVVTMPIFPKLQSLIDVLIAGRFLEKHGTPSVFAGLENKTIHYFSDRYRPSDFEVVPISEVIIGPTGELTLTGFDPMTLRTE